MSKLVRIAGGSTLIFLTLALCMGVFPGIELSRIPAGPGVKPLSPLQAEGREIYVANGCSYCHTQQVRPLPQDKVFGRPSAPGDFAYQTPELLGSERTGPDLTNVGTRQPSTVWQYLHLYNPRAVVPASIMPAFDWLFEHVEKPPAGTSALPLPARYAPSYGVIVPTHAADALIAYVLSLKQPPLVCDPPGVATPGVATPGVDTPAAGSPAAAAAPTEKSQTGYDPVKGQSLFIASCSPCHQATGEGLPGAFPPLQGDPAVNDADASRHIHVVLHGLQGAAIAGVAYSSAMPSFSATLSDSDISDILDYERSSWGNHGTPVTPQQVAAARTDGK
jgi:cytochrome c oxidase cbb3-type subunit 2